MTAEPASGEEERFARLDDVWVLTLLTALFVTALPWFLHGVDIHLSSVSLGLLYLGAIHVGFAATAAQQHSRPWVRAALVASHYGGIVALGFIWLHAGALQNPMFLIVFAVPVIGSSVRSRWQPYLTAFVSIVVVLAVALLEVPELRWRLSEIGGHAAEVAALFDSASGDVHSAFQSFYAPASYFIVLLEGFSIGLIVCAVFADFHASVIARLYTDSASALAAAERAHEHYVELIRNLPVPAALVDVESLRIVSVSKELAAAFDFTEEQLAGRRMLEVVSFAYPEVIEDLITTEGGVARPCIFRVASRMQMGEVRVSRVVHEGHPHALLVIQDFTELFSAKGALDAAESATLVIDARARVVALNKPAAGLFAGAVPGKEIQRQLSHLHAEQNWWDPGVRGRRKLHIEISRRKYQVTMSALELPGEQEPLVVLSLLPVAKTVIASPARLPGT